MLAFPSVFHHSIMYVTINWIFYMVLFQNESASDIKKNQPETHGAQVSLFSHSSQLFPEKKLLKHSDTETRW